MGVKRGGSGVCGGLWRIAGASWHDGRLRSSLVQRGRTMGAAVVFLLLSTMSGEREGNGAEE
jgi:hypothetical protein